MSINRILVMHAEGVGNCVQIIPCLRTIKEVLGYNIDYLHMFGTFSIPHIIPYVNKWFVGNTINKINLSDYDGIVSTFWTRNHVQPFLNAGMRLLNKIQGLRMDRSEIDVYMDIARDLGAQEEDLLWYGKCNYNKMEEKFDIVISDGYNRQGSADWSIKQYPYYKEVVSLLKERSLRICSLGAPSEYVSGTMDKTGLPLLDSLGIIANSKLVLSNDSGLYHAANALGVKNIVIFTATSIDKNFDSRFHKFSTIIGRDDLDCRPCQAGRGWKRCKVWDCREIKPETIYNKVMEVLNERSV